MFICPKCKNELPCSCGYKPKYINEIMQLTDLPDMQIDTSGDNYIGYEHIGKAYSGYEWATRILNKNVAIANRIKSEMLMGFYLMLGVEMAC